MNVIQSIDIPGFRKLRSGKVRELFDIGTELLMVATDRISAFDVVMNQGIPGKGEALTSVSRSWFELLDGTIPHHYLSSDLSILDLDNSMNNTLSGRSMIVKKAEPFPVECVVRGYLTGSALSEYKVHGTVHGGVFPAGIPESGKLAEPVFTPSTKSETGHDENISFDRMTGIVGNEVANVLKELSLKIYSIGSRYAAEKGIIIADTKFEFGLADDGIILIDEVLTPDSSRFWPANSYEPGRKQPSLDKQILRDYLAGLDWARSYPPPEIPDEVIKITSEKYIEISSLLRTG